MGICGALTPPVGKVGLGDIFVIGAKVLAIRVAWGRVR